MKIIAIAAVTAGGKTTVVNEIKTQLKSVKSLHFDDYTFEGQVDDFYAWVTQGANYNVWDLSPLIKDIYEIKRSNNCEYLLLDYPFAYCHKELSKYIDCAIFIDTPLDIAAMQGRIWVRWMDPKELEPLTDEEVAEYRRSIGR